MKYGIDYRHLAKGATTMTDNTRQVDVEVDEKQFALIPNVGDYVDIPAEDEDIRKSPRALRPVRPRRHVRHAD